MHYRKKFLVEPDSRVRLNKVDPGYRGKSILHGDAPALVQDAVARMDHGQYLLYASARKSLLIVLQGPDAAGKDGVIRHLFTGLNPQGTTVHRFTQPTREQMAHDFLWRVHSCAPAKGEIAVFNRSHYEDVLVTRVHKLVPRRECFARFEAINDFERQLHRNGTSILKFYLHISPDEQLERFRRRLDDPMRNWKISESDYLEREFWPKYVHAYEEVFERTSTKHSPWFVIPSNYKWFRDLAISEIIASTLEGMKLRPPAPSVDLDDIKQRFHHAETEEPELERETGLT
ncbi:polyphosphate kinase 2 family protein [Sphingobium xenophagum]|uniref:Polyphosphate kinase-2-related domain-containing protein n=1 Tax=Sphingobium xenophagum TaxID=121428 RepID=A0A401J386_SPHXE|nr:polyphosphate kinase 2 family protein [Sphingobium xenophagum]GBH31086.1 hypothetical protein MBESOW_P2347 [Sphingobium xenophagum]